jgi:hypothetical protein
MGGGADPLSNQVSMEQDLALARDVLGARGVGVLLYGSADGQTLVQVEDDRPLSDGLAPALAELLDPRPGRQARYRRSTLAPDAPALRVRFLRELVRHAQTYDDHARPLLVFVAAHGEPGDEARDNSILFWGGAALRVRELATTLDAAAAARPLLLVASSCFSGGFAELVFRGADPRQASAVPTRCGLFASTWDREAEGCDPNPDRRAQESYGLHFFHALRGEDRDGKPLPPGALDFDGDGRVSAAEAHARVRLSSRSVSVPTSSSERWLRHAVPRPEAGPPMPWPEEEAVIRALGAELELPDGARAVERQQQLAAEIGRLGKGLEHLELERDERWHALTARLLERWPVLADAWHRDFDRELVRDREAIAELLVDSPEAAAYGSVEAACASLASAIDELETESALVDRLVRAHENRLLAGALWARGGADFAELERLLACERSWP